MTLPIQSKTVAESYQALVDSGVIESDAAQRQLVNRLDTILDEERSRHLSRKSSSLGWMFGRKRGAPVARGLYIHGAVGRGKSMLMDIFFALVPGESKRRAHFNAFMADAHERIHRQRRAFGQGKSREADPIPPVGRDLAREARLLCFDEFAVNDIADAMVLGRLFSILFEEGVRVIATSNVVPDDLYRDGLNRQLFLPFVDMLKHRLDVFELDARTDFRLEKVAGGRAYLSPLTEKHAQAMESIWEGVTSGLEHAPMAIRLKGRDLPVRRWFDRAAWFTFAELCLEPRSAEDYLAIAERFDTVFVEAVPMMDLAMRNAAKRFILLVDTLYDNGIRTVISAEANPHALYQASTGAEIFEFRRTASRLIEMQSRDYGIRGGGESLAEASG